MSKERVAIDPQGSKHSGIAGLFETLLRRFKDLTHMVTLLPMYVVGSVCLGLSLVPSILFFNFLKSISVSFSALPKAAILGFALASGYFLFGFSMLITIPLLNRALAGKLKPWRGTYYSLATVKWYTHNGLTYLMRYLFLEFFTPTPFNIYFYRAMGMKIGKGTQINSSHISDPSLIELGNGVTIGGSATLCGHYGMAGYLILAPVKIDDGAIIGLRAIVMGGVTIGANAKLLPNSVALPKTVIPAGETWGGIPAVKISGPSIKNNPEDNAA